MTLPSDPAYPIADFNKMLSDAKIELSPIELAEILWLAVQQSEGIAPVDLSSKSPESKTESSKTIDSSATKSSTVPPETKSEVRAKIGMDSAETQEGAKKATTPLPVKIPEAVALRNRREIAKALRPLMRKVPSRIRQAIAEEETAIRIAEDRIWSPVVKPEPERWLELAIVIEVTNLFDVWRDTIAEFQHLMERHGAFRDVRTWQLQTSGNSKPQLFLQTATGLNRKPRSPKELLDAGRRRLILFLSDCTSRAWRSGEIFKLLELWSRGNPVTIVQLLPERHWDRSALRLGSLVALRSQLPGALSQDWIVERLSPRRRQRLRGGLKLPVVTIQPQPLGWWARATAAVGEQRTTGIVLRADAFQVDKPADAMTETLTAKQLVERFRGTASEKAQELADMMAVLPVNWSVLRLIQKNLVQKSANALQETGALYLAEIFLSGLLRPVSIAAEPDQKLSTTQQYDFVEGVRNVLLGAIPISEAREVGEEIATTIFKQLPAEVQERVNADIVRRWGESLSYFEAFLMPDLPWGDDAAVEMLPFAQVTGDVLRRWGGKYAELAEELEQKRTPPEPVVVTPNPELKTILLVEDEQKVIEDISEVLSSQYGIAVRGTDDVNKVIEQAESSEIDLILINYELPYSRYQDRRVNGLEIVRILRANPHISSNLPIIGFSLDPVANRFLEIGADGFYSKGELLDSGNYQKFVCYLQEIFHQVTQANSSNPGKNYAIAIGIDRYVNLVSNLYAVKDAEDIHNWLSREAGFEQVRLFTDNSFPLAREPGNPESSQLTPELLARFLDETLKTLPMSVEDNLWFFFSGHGIHLENIDYLVLPANISDRVEDTAVPVSFIVEQLHRYGTGNVILFLDADRDLAASYSTNLRIVRNPQQEFGSTAIAPPRPLPNRGTIVFYSSSPGEGACEIESLQHGAFTHAFLEILQQRKVGEAITVESLAQQLQDRVPALTQQYNKPRQTPEVIAEPDSRNSLVLLPPRTKIPLQEFEFEIAEIVFEEESRVELETFQFQQANIEVQLFRSDSYASQDLPEGIHPNIERINAEFIRSNCLRGLESLHTEQEKVQFAKAMWMSTDFGEDGINRMNTCSLQQIVTETALAMDILQTMGIALDRQNALRYLQELNNGLSNPQLENITDRFLSDNYQQLFNRQPATSGRSLLCTYVEWFHLHDNLVTVVGREEQPKAIILPDEFVKLIPDNWEPKCCPRPECIVAFQYITSQGQQYTEVLAGNVPLQMVRIPQGGFMMGAPKSEEGSTDDERPQHEVSIETFFLGKYPITWAQYKAVMGEIPSYTYLKEETYYQNYPVETVSWDEAKEFCRRLSEQTGKEYRLPSEAEWEYACRAGTTTPFHFGETLDAKVANYNASYTYGRGQKGEYRDAATSVGIFKVANAFGLFDMHGNVREWCEDNWHDNYEGAPIDGSAWVELNETFHSYREGSWYHIPQLCRSACRSSANADFRTHGFGFRIACSARGLL